MWIATNQEKQAERCYKSLDICYFFEEVNVIPLYVRTLCPFGYELIDRMRLLKKRISWDIGQSKYAEHHFIIGAKFAGKTRYCLIYKIKKSAIYEVPCNKRGIYAIACVRKISSSSDTTHYGEEKIQPGMKFSKFL